MDTSRNTKSTSCILYTCLIVILYFMIVPCIWTLAVTWGQLRNCLSVASCQFYIFLNTPKRSLEKEIFIWLPRWGGIQVIMEGGYSNRNLRQLASCPQAGTRERWMLALSSRSLYYSVWCAAAHIYRWSFCCYGSPLPTPVPRDSQRCVSWVILNPVMLTVVTLTATRLVKVVDLGDILNRRVWNWDFWSRHDYPALVCSLLSLRILWSRTKDED